MFSFLWQLHSCLFTCNDILLDKDWLAVHYSCDLKKCTSMRRNIHSTSEQRLVLWSKTSTQDLIRVNKTWCDKLDKYARDCVIKVVINWANTGLLSIWPPSKQYLGNVIRIKTIFRRDCIKNVCHLKKMRSFCSGRKWLKIPHQNTLKTICAVNTTLHLSINEISGALLLTFFVPFASW